jgi:hypothetical protein
MGVGSFIKNMAVPMAKGGDMRLASMIVGAIGTLATLMALIGRYRAVPSVTFLGHSHHAGSVLMAAVPILLIAILLALLAQQERK